MDLGEILSYKPDTSSKRAREDGEEEEEVIPPRKIMKQSEQRVNSKEVELTDEEKLRLLQSVDDSDDEGDVQQLDATAVKIMLLNFERQVLKNQEMRIKFPDHPEKFMESELELHDEIQKLHVIATVPQYYGILTETNTITTFLGLLGHDNSDVAIGVVDLIQQLTDADVEDDEQEEEIGKLIEGLLNEQVVALLVQNLERLDEKVREDGDGVHNTLAIIENMCEYSNAQVTAQAGEQGLLLWLLKRVRVRQYDPNKLYASEILAILLQGNETTQRVLGEMEGIDILLQSIAYYKRKDPQSVDEVELMENLFDCLCSSLTYVPNRDKFLKGEGLQLMRLMLQSKKQSRWSALKVLNHAMCGVEGKDNCVKFIEIFGLGSLFPSFMKTPKKQKKIGLSEKEHEEHVCSIIMALFRNTSGALKDRLVGKFLENDHEKVDRLLELHLKYLQQVRDIDVTIRQERRMKASVDSDETELEDYVRRLDGGLFILQLIDYVMLELCVGGIASIRHRIYTVLNQHGENINVVRTVMEEYIEQMTEEDAMMKDSIYTMLKDL